MPQSGHNTSIASSRQGCRLPHETQSVGDGYAASGPVVSYRLSPEEIAARYGRPTEKPPGCSLTRRALVWAIETHESLAKAAAAVGVSPKHLKSELARHELPIPEGWEEECQVEEATNYEAQAEKPEVHPKEPGELTKEVYQKLIAGGLNKTQIMKKYGYRPQGFYMLLEKWGLHQRQKCKAANKPGSKDVTKTITETISVAEALKRREKAIKNLRCIEDILESQAEVTNDVKATLNDLCRQYKEDVGRINKALEQVKIAL